MESIHPFKTEKNTCVAYRFKLLARRHVTEVQLLWFTNASAVISCEKMPSLALAVQWSSLEALPAGYGAR